jgi:hypothetical protein
MKGKMSLHRAPEKNSRARVAAREKKENKMRKNVKIGLVGLMVAVGVAPLAAQDWVQNASFALTATVQTPANTVQTFSISTKTIIEYLRGITLTNTYQNPPIVTTNTPTPLHVTNNAFLPNAFHPRNAFPPSFVVGYYSVTIGTNSFTNHVSANFMNDIILTQVPSDTDTNLIEYEFANAVVLGTNVTGFATDATVFLFTNWPAASPPGLVRAFLDTNAIPAVGVATNTVFTLIGVTITTTTTNVAGLSIPKNFASKNPALIVKSVAGIEDLTFFIRDATKAGTNDYDVSPFFNYNPHLHEAHQAKGTGFNDFLDMSIDFNNYNGMDFQTEANGKQARGTVSKQGIGLFVKSVTATCAGGGDVAKPPSGQPATGKPYPTGVMVVTGKFTVSGGKIEIPKQ